MKKICPVCKITFNKSKNISKSQWENRKCCSLKCGKLKVPIEKFKENQLIKMISNTITTPIGCMEWQGYINPITKYGQVTFLNKTNLAHRLIWKLTYGEIFEGLCVLHSCDNRKCININHLFLGTKLDNHSDMVSKGRRPIKLSKQNKEKIIELIKEGILQKDIAKEFNVHQVTIGQIALKNGIRKQKSHKNGWIDDSKKENNKRETCQETYISSGCQE